MLRSLTPRSLTLALALSVMACSPRAPASGEGAREAENAEVVVDTAPEVPDDRPVVVFLGTSLTAGLGLARDEDTYVARVAELADSAGTPIRAVNAGVSGETSAGGLRRLDWVLRDPVDVLVLELGANDGLRGQDPFATRNNLVEIMRRTRTRYPAVRIVLAGMEAPPNLGPLFTDAFREVFASAAEQEGALLIPFLLDGVAGVPELNQSDRIHPTAQGHSLMADNVWEVLGPLLAEMAEGAGEAVGAGSRP
jgi:acyl-CoA thioesterase I